MKTVIILLLVVVTANFTSAQTEQQRWEKANFYLSTNQAQLMKTIITFNDIDLTNAQFDSFKNSCYQKEEFISVQKIDVKQVVVYYTNSFFQDDLKFFITPYSTNYGLSKEMRVEITEAKQEAQEKQ